MYVVFFLLVGCFWGGSFVAIKYSLLSFPPIVAATLRVGIGTLFLLGFYLLTRKKFLIPKSQIWRVWGSGLFILGIPFSFLFWAEKSVSAGLAGIVNGSLPIWTYLLGRLYFNAKDRSSGFTILGIGLGFVGLLILNYPALVLGQGADQLMGIVALLIMALCYALGTHLNRRLLATGKVDLYANVFQQHFSSFLFLVLVSFFLVGTDWTLGTGVRLESLLGVTYMGIFSTAIAWMLFYQLIRAWGAVRASAITYIVPPVALLMDFLFLGHPAGPTEMVGALCILGGVFLIQNPPKPAS